MGKGKVIERVFDKPVKEEEMDKRRSGGRRLVWRSMQKKNDIYEEA